MLANMALAGISTRGLRHHLPRAHHALDLIGIFVFGVSGGLMAIQRDFDLVGVAILAVITALGGGILRDLVLGDTPPLAFADWKYLAVALAAAAVTFVAHPELNRVGRTLLLFDAAGLGLFCVAGTVKALDWGMTPLAAVTLGVTTAVGGGVLRDVIARETPALVRRDSGALRLPALAGAIAVAVAWELDGVRARPRGAVSRRSSSACARSRCTTTGAPHARPADAELRHDHAVAAAGLRDVERAVGARRAAPRRRTRRRPWPRRRRRPSPAARRRGRRRSRRAALVGERDRLVDARAGQQDEELLAADPVGEVERAQPAAQAVRDLDAARRRRARGRARR